MTSKCQMTFFVLSKGIIGSTMSSTSVVLCFYRRSVTFKSTLLMMFGKKCFVWGVQKTHAVMHNELDITWHWSLGWWVGQSGLAKVGVFLGHVPMQVAGATVVLQCPEANAATNCRQIIQQIKVAPNPAVSAPHSVVFNFLMVPCWNILSSSVDASHSRHCFRYIHQGNAVGVAVLHGHFENKCVRKSLTYRCNP